MSTKEKMCHCSGSKSCECKCNSNQCECKSGCGCGSKGLNSDDTQEGYNNQGFGDKSSRNNNNY